MTTYKIEGMTCNGCASAVGKAIQRVVPGAKVAVDHKAGTAKLEGAPDDAAIARAIEDAGFAFKGRTAD
jgi:copper chaperone